MTEMFREAWSPMSAPDLAPDDDDDACLIEAWRLRGHCTDLKEPVEAALHSFLIYSCGLYELKSRYR